MANSKHSELTIFMLTAGFLTAFPSRCGLASVTEQVAIAPMVTDGSVALYISLCLWSPQHPSPTCRDVPLTPGAAGPVFASIEACQAGQEDALQKWRAEAGPVFGFTAMAGDGYRINGTWCSRIASSSLTSDRDE